MIESPLLQEILAEERLQVQRQAIVAFLTSRFGGEAAELKADLKAIEDEDRLNELIKHVGHVPQSEIIPKASLTT